MELEQASPSLPPATAGYDFLRLDDVTLEALLDGDLDAASHRVGAPLPELFIDLAWLWRIRLPQVRDDPASAGWIARAARHRGTGMVVGHLGFHQPPDADGMVEVAYEVDPAHRRQGHATAMLRQALGELAGHPVARAVRASINPENAASLATVARFGFAQVGEQWDEEDGLEQLWELRLPAPADLVPQRTPSDPWGS